MTPRTGAAGRVTTPAQLGAKARREVAKRDARDAARRLNKALKDVRSGDVLLAHLGIWSRQDPWAPAVLEPLITGLQAQGFCFKTLREHPQYQAWIETHAPVLTTQTGK